MTIAVQKPITIRLVAATWEELTVLAGTVKEQLPGQGRAAAGVKIVPAAQPTLDITLRSAGTSALDIAPPPARATLH